MWYKWKKVCEHSVRKQLGKSKQILKVDDDRYMRLTKHKCQECGKVFIGIYPVNELMEAVDDQVVDVVNIDFE